MIVLGDCMCTVSMCAYVHARTDIHVDITIFVQVVAIQVIFWLVSNFLLKMILTMMILMIMMMIII